MLSEDNDEMTKRFIYDCCRIRILRENVPMDFKSITLTTRSNSLSYDETDTNTNKHKDNCNIQSI